ncbi:hypothetical protein ACFX11_036470 [Malus domestica]
MIRGHAWSETPWKSVELYKRLVHLEAEADGFSYSYVLSACARSGLVIEGEQVHKRVLVSGFGGGVECARQVFDGMRERNIASWNSLLAGYVWCQDVDGAHRIFNEITKWNMRRPGVELDKVALMAPLLACAKKGA